MSFVGPEPITIRKLLLSLKEWFGIKTSRFIQIPYNLSSLGCSVLELVTKSPVTRDSIKMLNAGNIADVSEMTNNAGVSPRSLSSVLNESPVQQADLWHAKLLMLAPLLRLSIAFVWIYTGIISVFVYPLESSYQLLEQVGITGMFAPVALYGAAIIDLLLGVALLIGYKINIVGTIQISIIMTYTILITIFLSEQWAHPFGPVSKNIPLIVSIMIMMILEKDKG